MQFGASYLLGLNELVGLAYVLNLGLLMKRAPDVIQCQTPGSTGPADDHVYSTDFSEHYTEHEFWTGI